MKLIAINGSPREKGNTYSAIKMVLEEIEKEGIETEIINVGKLNIRGCLACNRCVKNRDERCVIDDDVNGIIQKLKGADGIIFGSPVHFAAMGSTMKSFMDRLFYVVGMNGGMFRHKVGASVVAVRRSGGIPTFNQLNNYINYAEMLMPTSNYWSVIHGTRAGEVNEDEEGKQIMRVLGKNTAWLMKIVENAKGVIEAPKVERKVFTNFVR